jgi:hypothetical protein
MSTFDHVLKIALKGYEGNVRIEFRMPDGRRARGDLCEGVERVMELLYADDLVIICETEKLLNEVILSFERATQAWGLTRRPKCQEDQNTYSKQ